MIARDGWSMIAISLVMTLLFLFGALKWDKLWLMILAALWAALTVFVIFFFRDPERTANISPGELLSPADGTIIAIKPVEFNEHLNGPATRVSIFLSVFNVHVNRIPTDGTIDYVKYNRGKFLAAFNEKASLENEQTEIGMTTTDGHRLVFKQIAGLIARRIVCRLEKGDEVHGGERFGLIRFGSRVDVIVPAETDIRVAIGDHVKGGETILAKLMAVSEKISNKNTTGQNNVEL